MQGDVGEAPPPMCRSQLSVLLCMSLTACGAGAGGGGDDDGGGDQPPLVDAGVDAGPVWSFTNVYGVPNLDDDDENGNDDWSDPLFADDDDLASLTLPTSILELVPAGGDVELSLTGATNDVRLYRNGELVLGGNAGTTYTFTPEGTDVELAVELRTYLTSATLSIAARAPGGAIDATSDVHIQAAPLIMNHHLQPAEHVWAVRVNGNAAMLDAFETALGARFSTVSGATYGGDVWIQDEIEFATLTGSPTLRLDVVIDSVRNRGLDDFPEDALVGPGMIAPTWGTSPATTFDSFGNLEASPPVTVGGVNYPFGRIYYGYSDSIGIDDQVRAFLASQRVQAPIELPTWWLCVGHVDEFVTFVPDASSPKGFKMVISDVPAAWELIDALPANMSLGIYGPDHGYSTVGSLQSDTYIRAYNDDLQTDYLDPIRTKLMTELGLDESDVIRLPSLFEPINGCSGRGAALIPGMANLVIAKADGVTHLFTADPFFRPNGAAQSTDPIIAEFKKLMPSGMEMHFVDDWDVYHMGLGEVHCGTNVKRTPAGRWWTEAMHLMGGN